MAATHHIPSWTTPAPAVSARSTAQSCDPNSTGSHDGISTARSGFLDVQTEPGPADALNSHHRTRVALRKKPKSSSISSSPSQDSISGSMRRLSGISKSFPTFHPHSEPKESRPVRSQSHGADGTQPPSTPKLPPQSNLPPNRSPPQKRKPPASHSSYGVETSLGPPPSYSTQRTLSQDRVRPGERSPKTGAGTERVTPHPHEAAISSKQQPREQPVTEDITALPVPRPSDSDFSSPETLDSQSVNTPLEGSDITTPTSAGETNMNEGGDNTSRGLGLDGTHDDAKASSSDETQKSEDLFLNIAKTDAPRAPAARVDKRRSRISLPFFSSKPSTGVRSSPMSAQFESSHLTPRSERPPVKRSSLGQHVPGSLTPSSYIDESRSQAGGLSDLRSVADSTGDRSQLRSRRYSNANVDTLRPPTRSRTNRMVSENLYSDRYRAGDQVATESTISTTAPSTVWDELDDLKSRIRKLELTGKLPPSSAAAMTSTERPRTATTAATTMSSSPKHNKPAGPPLPSAIEGIASNVHPLLHEALSNAKAAVSQNVYQKLHAAAQDALVLSSILSQEGYGSNGSALSQQTERQVRRRTESMCRSLTELAIALLADNRAVSSPTVRPGSREQHSGSATALRTRRYSSEATDRPPVASRVQSRLDSRRTSLLMGQTQAANASPETATFRTPPGSVASQPISASRVSRVSTVTRIRRTQNQTLDGASDNEEASPAVRPVSRAMTEVGTNYRALARDRANFSREYTKQHPMPTPQVDTASLSSRTPLPSNLSTNHLSRRIYPSSASVIDSSSPIGTNSPITPSQTHIARPPFTISIERRNVTDSHTSSPITSTPESAGNSDRRPSSTRRSLGFASRISNVSNRLKAARAERVASNTHTAANTAAVRSPLAKEGVEMQDTENEAPSASVALQQDNGGEVAVGNS